MSEYVNTNEGGSFVDGQGLSSQIKKAETFSQKNLNKKDNAQSISPFVEQRKKKIIPNSAQIKIPRTSSHQAFNAKQNKSKKVRLDVNGTEIERKNKRKVKISFVDTTSNVPLCDVIYVESYKSYNVCKMPMREDLFIKSKECCSCLVF